MCIPVYLSPRSIMFIKLLFVPCLCNPFPLRETMLLKLFTVDLFVCELHINRIIQWLSFCIWFFSLNIVRFMLYSFLMLYCNPFINFIVNEHFDCFHFLSIMNKVAMNILVPVLADTSHFGGGLLISHCNGIVLGNYYCLTNSLKITSGIQQ